MATTPLIDKRVFVAKLGTDGSHRWSSALGEMGDIWVNDVAVGRNGDIAVVGNFRGLLQLGGELLEQEGAHSTFVLALRADGSHAWHAEIEGPLLYADQVVAVDPAGNVAVAGAYSTSIDLGMTQLTPDGRAGTYVTYFASDGTMQWGIGSKQTHGPVDDTVPAGIAMGQTGEIYVTGHFRPSDVAFGSKLLINADGVGQDVFLLALDPSDGSVGYAHRYGSVATQLAGDLDIDDADRLAITGSFNESINFGGALTNLSARGDAVVFLDAFAGKLAAGDGSHIWSRSYGPFNAPAALSTGVGSDAAGNTSFVGRTAAQSIDFGVGALPTTSADGWFLFRAGTEGTPLWSKALDASGKR